MNSPAIVAIWFMSSKFKRVCLLWLSRLWEVVGVSITHLCGLQQARDTRNQRLDKRNRYHITSILENVESGDGHPDGDVQKVGQFLRVSVLGTSGNQQM